MTKDADETTLNEAGIASLLAELGQDAAADPSRRVVAGIAGSGKSTLAEQLVADLNPVDPGIAVGGGRGVRTSFVISGRR